MPSLFLRSSYVVSIPQRMLYNSEISPVENSSAVRFVARYSYSPLCSLTRTNLSDIFSALAKTSCVCVPLWTLSLLSVSYTHLRAHETRHDLVCRLLLEK